VWPHVIKIGTWMTDHRLETIDGQEATVGHFERVWPKDLDETTQEPQYHLYGIVKLIPERLVVLEVFPEKGGSYGDAFYPPEFVNFDAILLTGCGDTTQVSFYGIEVFAEHDDAYDEGIQVQINRYFDNLRELCESS
jgi:hypothetical protein